VSKQANIQAKLNKLGTRSENKV